MFSLFCFALPAPHPSHQHNHLLSYVLQSSSRLTICIAGPLGDNFRELPLLQRLNWLHVPLLVLTPILGLYGLFTAKWYWQTMLFTFFYYFFSGFGITAGAYNAGNPVSIVPLPFCVFPARSFAL
jgi:hypothetical protein